MGSVGSNNLEGFSFSDIKDKISGALTAAEDLVGFANDFDVILPAPYVTVLQDVQKILEGLQTAVNKV